MPDQNDNLLNYALRYAQLGWHVFPIIPRRKKPPLIKAWQKYASKTEKTIRNWWKKWPDANIGIATGNCSGIVVLDVDPEKYGDWSLLGIERLYGKLPQTPISITGTLGKHLIFQQSENIRNSSAKLGNGLDVRGTGGYILAPPSIHPNGNAYVWEISPWQNGELVTLPQGIINFLTYKPPDPVDNGATKAPALNKELGLHWIGRAIERVYGGEGRNEAGLWLACQLRDFGFTQDQVWRFMRVYRVLLPQKTHPYSMFECRMTVDSVFSRPPRKSVAN